MDSSSADHVYIEMESPTKRLRFNWQEEDGEACRNCCGAVKSTVTKMVMLVNGPDVSPFSLLLDHMNIGINK